MYAFLSHSSACEALRVLGARISGYPRWPAEPRELPRHYNTVTNQRSFKQYCSTVDLSAFGVTGTPVDLLVPKAEQRSRGKAARFHAWKRAVPLQALIRLTDTLFLSSPEFVLVQMATWQARLQPIIRSFSQELHDVQESYDMAGLDERAPYDDPFSWDKKVRTIGLVLVMMEFLGTYRLSTSTQETTYQQPPLMTLERLKAFLSDIDRSYGANRLRQAMTLALPHSASPMETALALMLSLPAEFGGYGLPQPELNRELPVRDHELLWSGGAAITPDLLWKDGRFVIEYDSDEQHGSGGARKLANDATRANVMTAMGYHVMRATTLNVQTPTDVDRIARQVATCLGKEIPEPDDVLRIRRTKLHQLLMSH